MLPCAEFMMEPILDYAIYVHFSMDGIYDEPIVDYAIYVNFAMVEIYDGTLCKLWYSCTF